ncbi:MAG: N-acetylmuramoyl-L-alanine amidase [gamma proteobacterium symbiont of Bathyaustriella thionipta]|nr:N-acetylmuramoyl-L-alanine amidase [gamma proteobacterium symbiont of Bathyaustriella thionipta]
MRLWSAPDHTRLVFDVDAAVEHKIFTLKSPDRLVIDISNARLTVKPQQATSQDQFIRQVRFGKQDKRNSRIVLDLKKTVQPRSFVLKPNKQYGHRLVVDVYQKASDSKQKSKSVKTVSKTYHRDVVIAIDAGHGGEDPGASGAKGSKEKRVTLAIAKKLKALVDAEKGMSAVLTRKGDYYIPLRQRMDIARKYKADLFVSIHADAFKDPRASGASVYVLSRRGASSEAAKWLAKQENAADLIGGVKLGDKDDVLASVLMDLSQSATIQASNGAAGQVLSQLKRLGKVHGRKVQRAGFMVLKSPDMPSMLVETAFISNPQEERRLNSAAHQKRLAKAILSGVKNYFQQSPPPGSLMASQQSQSDIVYIVKAGDTLSAIASRYQISLNVIRSYNKLRTDVLSIGKRLTIPARSDS